MVFTRCKRFCNNLQKSSVEFYFPIWDTGKYNFLNMVPF